MASSQPPAARVFFSKWRVSTLLPCLQAKVQSSPDLEDSYPYLLSLFPNPVPMHYFFSFPETLHACSLLHLSFLSTWCSLLDMSFSAILWPLSSVLRSQLLGIIPGNLLWLVQCEWVVPSRNAHIPPFPKDSKFFFPFCFPPIDCWQHKPYVFQSHSPEPSPVSVSAHNVLLYE